MQRPTRMMIVDDNAGDRHLLREALAEAGWAAEITEAPSGIAAIALLQRLSLQGLPPDLILLDYVLREDSCEVVIERIRALSEYENCPIIVMTSALPPPGNQEHCFALGVLRIVIKPCDFPAIIVLMAKLKKIFAGKTQRSGSGKTMSDSDLALLATT